MSHVKWTGERKCRICETPTVLIERNRLRYGLIEEACECATCGQRFKTFGPGGHALWFGIAVALFIASVYAFAAGKVKAGDGPAIVFCLLLLLVPTVYIGAKSLAHDRRNPRVR